MPQVDRDGVTPFVIAPNGSDRFLVKDSGKRQEFTSGMVRDVDEGKVNYGLVLDGPMFERWAAHLTKGAKKYARRNWMLATGQEEYERFKESALRHFVQWWKGERDEDHAAAVMFNVNGAEYVAGKLREELPQTAPGEGGSIDDPYVRQFGHTLFYLAYSSTGLDAMCYVCGKRYGYHKGLKCPV